MDLSFVVNSILLGVGLAMDAFSVSLANGLDDPRMGRGRICVIAGTFAFFQFLMPLAGWFCVHTVTTMFHAVQPAIPWIALLLLCFLGGKMIREGIRGGEAEAEEAAGLTAGALILQGIATSIDALSVGFTIADYNGQMAFLASVIIAAVTFIICVNGVLIGKKAGTRLAGRASVLGGTILIAIGVEIVLTHLL